MKKVVIIFIMALLIVTGCGKKEPEKKGVLYKYNVEDFDFMQLETKSYNVNYTGKVNGIPIKARSMFILNKDGSCSQNGSSESDYDITTILSKSCSYTINDNVITINSTVENAYFSKTPDVRPEKKEEVLNITGEFLDNGRTLQIGKLNYSSVDYEHCWKKYIQEILFDPTTKRIHKLDGSYLFDDPTMENYEIYGSHYKDYKLDIKDYEIKTVTNSNE